MAFDSPISISRRSDRGLRGVTDRIIVADLASNRGITAASLELGGDILRRIEEEVRLVVVGAATTSELRSLPRWSCGLAEGAFSELV